MAKRNAEEGAGPERVPGTVRAAGALAAVEGGVGVVVAIVLVVRGATGVDQSLTSAYGTAAWFVIFGGAVLAAGVGLLRGRRWGRAIVMIAQILLLPVSWYMIGSQPQYGIPMGLAALVTLGLLFSPPSTRWAAEVYDTGEVD